MDELHVLCTGKNESKGACVIMNIISAGWTVSIIVKRKKEAV